jgi:hypothetical protein
VSGKESETLFPVEAHFSHQVVARSEGSWLTTERGSQKGFTTLTGEGQILLGRRRGSRLSKGGAASPTRVGINAKLGLQGRQRCLCQDGAMLATTPSTLDSALPFLFSPVAFRDMKSTWLSEG